MREKKRSVILWIIMTFIIIGIAGWAVSYFHWNVELQEESFQESARELHNPNRGFYYIWGFRIKDEPADWSEDVGQRIKVDPDAALSLAEINLQEYRNGAISEAGMENIDALFTVLAQQRRNYIVRFLYDWYGENEQYEPQTIDIILGHMKQLEPILHKYADHIYTLQGLFIGNWGEMNGTQYADEESMQRLASTLASVSAENTYLAVRTPMQWRKITHFSDWHTFFDSKSPYANRLGLFNDGMLGNEGDYGTYGTQSKVETGPYKEWLREEELEFQDVLCSTVPLGGEVINDNFYNDFDNAVADFNRMHVSYLNEDYDRNVLQKWRNTVVHSDDCFDGMDGLSYMKARLGYRLVLKECRMRQDFWRDQLEIDLDIQNVGFAPIYKECEAHLVFRPKEGGKEYKVKVGQELYSLAGGSDGEQISTIHAIISLHSIAREEYDIYFDLTDKASGQRIYFANNQEAGKSGYKIGQIRQ